MNINRTFEGDNVPKTTKWLYCSSGMFRDLVYQFISMFLLMFAQYCGIGQDENYVAEDSVQYDVSDETENDDLTNNKNQIGSNQNIINEQPKSKSNNTQNQNGQNKQVNNQNNQANNMKNEGIKEEQNNQINENEDDM